VTPGEALRAGELLLDDRADVGLADAVVTLVSNLAARTRRRIEFKPSWFDVNSNEVPDAV